MICCAKLVDDDFVVFFFGGGGCYDLEGRVVDKVLSWGSMENSQLSWKEICVLVSTF